MKGILRWTIAFACIGYVVFFFWSKRSDLKIIFNFKPQMIFLLIILHFVFLLLHSYRYLIVQEKCNDVRIPFSNWFRVFILGRFLNQFIPQMGSVYRGVRLKEDFQISYTRYITGFFAFAWMDSLFNFLIALMVLLISGRSLRFGTLKAQYLLIVLIAFSAVGPIVLNVLLQLMRFRMKSLQWIHSRLSEVFAVTVGSFTDWRYILKVYLIGLVTFAQMCVYFYVGFLSFGISVTLPVIVLFYALYKLNTYVVITPGNFGILEIVFGVLSASLNIGMAQGIVISMTLRILSSIVLVALGLVFGGMDLLRHRDPYRTPDDKEQ